MRPLHVEHRHPRCRLLAVLLRGIGAIDLLLHVKATQFEDRKPVDCRTRSLRGRRRRRARDDPATRQLLDQPVVGLLNRVVPGLVVLVDRSLHLRDPGIGHLRRTGNVFLMPQEKIKAVEITDPATEPLLLMGGLNLVPVGHQIFEHLVDRRDRQRRRVASGGGRDGLACEGRGCHRENSWGTD